MSSKDWNKIYKKNLQVNRWPWSDLIRYFNIYLNKHSKKNMDVLELGSGTGPNAKFFFENNINYLGIEASSSGIQKSKKIYPDAKKHFICSDFTQSLVSKKKYDLIFDRGSVTHNTLPNVIKTIDLVEKSLKKNGVFFGFDWFSTAHSEYKKGKFIKGKNTAVFFKGPLKNVGNVSFFNAKIIKRLFKKFKILELTEKNYITLKDNKYRSSFWIVIAKKK